MQSNTTKLKGVWALGTWIIPCSKQTLDLEKDTTLLENDCTLILINATSQ